jgi:hypothetical protein
VHNARATCVGCKDYQMASQRDNFKNLAKLDCCRNSAFEDCKETCVEQPG